MATDDDLLARVRPRSTLLDMRPATARRPDTEWETPPDVPALDTLASLPQPGDAYKAHARPDNKALLMVRFLLRDGTVQGFAYSDMRHTRMEPGKDPGSGPVLVLRFVEAIIWEVRIEGRHLEVMADLIAYHRVAWMRELPPGKLSPEKNEAVITRIAIAALED